MASAAGSTSCGPQQLQVATGCASETAVRNHVEALIRGAMPELGLRSTIIRLQTGEHTVV